MLFIFLKKKLDNQSGFGILVITLACTCDTKPLAYRNLHVLCTCMYLDGDLF